MGKCVPSGGLNPPITGNNIDERFGNPNSLTRLFDALGNLIRERWFGPDGWAIWDRDHSAHHGAPNPHDHPWRRGPNGPERQRWVDPSGSC